jgi:hypothetical protein
LSALRALPDNEILVGIFGNLPLQMLLVAEGYTGLAGALELLVLPGSLIV